MIKKLLFLLTLLFCANVYAVAYQSNGTGGGLWSAALGTSWNAPPGIPGAGDSVTILAGDTITIDGTITIGNNPGDDVTYHVDVLGTLEWPQNPGADWQFTLQSSMRVQNGGTFIIGTSAAQRLNCANTARITWSNAAFDYDLRIEDGGNIKIYGCEGYKNTAGIVERALLSACSANPCVGAVTVTLDRAVNWDTCVAGDFCHLSIGTGGDPLFAYAQPCVGTDAEEITSALGGYTNVAANQISLTLANNHRVGDFFVKNTRNVLFESTSVTNHGAIYSLGGAMDISWMRCNECGESNAYTPGTSDAPALSFWHATKALGTWSFISVTNFEDGDHSSAFALSAGPLTTTNIVTDIYAYGGHTANSIAIALGFAGNGILGSNTIYNAVIIADSIDASSYGVMGYTWWGTNTVRLDGLWASDIGLPVYNGRHKTINSVINSKIQCTSNNAISGADALVPTPYIMSVPYILKDTTIRNIYGYGVRLETGPMYLSGVDINNTRYSCFYYGSSGSTLTAAIHLYDCSYDGCNLSNTGVWSQGGVSLYFSNNDVSMYNNNFGTETANLKNNIVIRPGSAVDNPTGNMTRLYCDECTFVAPTGPECVLQRDICVYGETVLWDNYTYLNPGTYLTLHNKNNVAGAHEGWGPGGMLIYHVTGAGPAGGWVDNSLNLHIHPGSCTNYHDIELGKISVINGTNLSVTVQIQKNAAQATGFRPRIKLEGPGFDPTEVYTEMTDVNNVWEVVTVSGTANAAGIVHIWAQVRNDCTGVDIYTPVAPATTVYYFDGISYTKS